METGKKIKTEEHIQKIKESNRENREKKIQEQEQLVNQIREETKDLLLPNIRSKMETVAEVIKEKVSQNNGLTVSQILPLITKRSVSDIATIQNKS